MSALNAAALASLADWVENELDDELSDRQYTLEAVLTQLRDMAAALRESTPPAPAGTIGPFETERQAHAAAVEAGGPLQPGWSILVEAQRRNVLLAACAGAGVELGAYDARILAWLARWEDSTVAVVAGLVSRAHLPELAEARVALMGAAATLDADAQAVTLSALEDAARAIRQQAALCLVCETHPAQLCEEHADQLRRAEAYDALAGRLAEVVR